MRFLFLLALAAASLAAQSLVLQNVNVIDGVSGTPRPGVNVTIRAGRIVAIAPAASLPGARVLDLKGKWVLPGLIDAHVHIAQVEAARAALESGVTTVRSLGVSNFIDVTLRDLHRGGEATLPEVLASGYHVRPQPAPDIFRDFPILRDLSSGVSGPDNVARVVRAMLSRNVDVIKILATERAGTPDTDPRRQTFSEAELSAAVAAAKAAKVPVAAHAHGREGGAAAVRAGVHSIEHGTWLDEDTLRRMKRQGTFLVPTIATVVDLIEPGGDYDHPALAERGREMLPALQATVRKARDLGLKLVAGTDTSYGARSVRRMPDEIAELKNLGLPPIEAIRAATVHAAECLGISERTGSIKPGREADLLVVEGNPLENLGALRRPLLVINNGQIVVNRSGSKQR
jgi:imidazolonepropionase-like amidohydrolase